MFRDQQKIRLLHQLQGHLGSDIPWLGVYTYFEIGPTNGYNGMHNYTAVMAVLYEGESEPTASNPTQPEERLVQQTTILADETLPTKLSPRDPDQLQRENQRLAEEIKRAATAVKGTGIGLALSKQIALAHGFEIWAESEGVGRGSTFIIEFGGKPS